MAGFANRLRRGSAAAIGGIVVAMLLALLSLSLCYSRQATIAQALRDAQNLAGTFEREVTGRIRLIDYALWEMTRDIEAAARAGKPADADAAPERLRARLAGIPGASAIFIVDATGRLTRATTLPNGPGIDVSDRAYFTELRDHPGSDLYISRPYHGRGGNSGDWVVAFARRFNNPDGSFGGVAAISTRITGLAASFATIDAGKTGSVVLWNTDDSLLARFPDPLPQDIGIRRPTFAPRYCTPDHRAATYERPADPGRRPARLVACRRLEDYPLSLTVALGREEVLAAWRGQAALYGVVVLLCGGVILGFAWYVGRLQAAALDSAEARLRDAIESIGDAFALFDASDRLEMWNGKFRDLLPDGAADLSLAGLGYEDLLRARLPLLADAQLDPEGFVARRLTQHHDPAAERVVEQFLDGRWCLIFERRTNAGGTVGIYTDISPLKRHEAHLEQLAEKLAIAKQQAEGANRAKSLFLASMSHELRTPLNAILGFSEMIGEQTLGRDVPERYVGYARDIHRSGAHLLDLINDLLDMSKIEAGRREIVVGPVDVTAIIDGCLSMLRLSATDAGITLRHDRPADLPLLVADQRAVKQILLNLLSNAIKFTPAGGTVRVRSGLDPGEGLWLEIADTGEGIAPAQLARLFEPFFGAERQTARRGREGLGLGLAICKGLVDAHGGRIALTSELGRGTTVTVTFPSGAVAGPPVADENGAADAAAR